MVKACAAEKLGVQRRLEEELNELKQATNMGHELSLEWVPDRGSKLSGEVKDSVIYIYEEDEAKAIRTLKHEFLDHLVSQAIEPYKVITNALIKTLNEDAYRRKEKIIDALTRLTNKDGL